MSLDFAISPLTSDLTIVGGKIQLATGTAEVVQRVRMRLKWLAGEWFLDTTKGLPWFQQILGVKDQGTASMLIRDQIAQTSGVDTVSTLNVRFDTLERKLSVYAVIVVSGQSIPVTQEVTVG